LLIVHLQALGGGSGGGGGSSVRLRSGIDDAMSAAFTELSDGQTQWTANVSRGASHPP
jgi:hypothetical protein